MNTFQDDLTDISAIFYSPMAGIARALPHNVVSILRVAFAHFSYALFVGDVVTCNALACDALVYYVLAIICV